MKRKLKRRRETAGRKNSARLVRVYRQVESEVRSEIVRQRRERGDAHPYAVLVARSVDEAYPVLTAIASGRDPHWNDLPEIPEFLRGRPYRPPVVEAVLSEVVAAAPSAARALNRVIDGVRAAAGVTLFVQAAWGASEEGEGEGEATTIAPGVFRVRDGEGESIYPRGGEDR